MAIKNKDGTIYKLDSPNPLLSNQNLKDKVLVHNFSFNEIIGKDTSRNTSIDSSFDILDLNIVNKPKEEAKPKEEIKPIEEAKPKEEIKPTEEFKPKEENKTKLTTNNKLIAWCLPSIQKKEINFYGEEKNSFSYGEKFSFETYAIERTGLECKLYCPTEKVTLKSIVYLYNEREWWMVNKILKTKTGYMLICYPSSHHPSF